MVDGLFGRLKRGAQSLYGSLFLYFGLDWYIYVYCSVEVFGTIHSLGAWIDTSVDGPKPKYL